MRAVLQRVKKAEVLVDNKIVGKINKGILVFIGIGKDDDKKDFEYITNKIANLRIFENENSHFDKSVQDINGEILFVSQFTLYGDCRKGRRPSFDNAENIEKSKILYKNFITYFKNKYPNINVQEGIFQTYMEVNLTNDGPVTFLLDSKKLL